MKPLIKLSLTMFAFSLMTGLYSQQKRDLDYYRQPDKRGINVFEPPKNIDTLVFDGVRVRIGGSSTLQYQALSHEHETDKTGLEGDALNAVTLKDINSAFNLATANLDLDVALAPGIRVHMRTYLSSRHHPEPYVKDGYLQIDRLDFISEGFLEDFMKYITVKVGHMEIDYGDMHYRRSDNAQTIYNPFVGNSIMDAFSTEVAGEIYVRPGGFIGMLGISNGKLNQGVDQPGQNDPALLLKLGYDTYDNYNNMRFRLTGSMYATNDLRSSYLYNGDRAGSRYYFVMENVNATSSGQFTSGRYNPRFTDDIRAIMFNPFAKLGGLEVFGILEFVEGKTSSETDTRNFNQYMAEVVYRFGNWENFYVGGRWNQVSGEEFGANGDIDITRWSLSGGWFLTKNILMKAEYVNQKYDGFANTDIKYNGKFDGFMLEAAISF